MTRLTAGLLAAGVFGFVPAIGAADLHPQTAFINEQIAAKWKENEIKKTAGKATDNEFLRRVFIDIIGRIATLEEVLDFEQDTSPNKRAKLVKRLLYDTDFKPKVNGNVVKPDGKTVLTFDYADEYAQNWSHTWTVWLTSRTVESRYRDQMRVWLQKAFLENKSYKDFVTEVLTAKGKTNENGAVNFILHHLGDATPMDKRTELGPFDAVPITSRVTRLFLGLQTQCTQCHDHPFKKEWVQSDFWGVNAFFRTTVRKGTPTPRPTGNNNQMMATLAVVELGEDAGLNTSGRIYFERRDGKLMAAKPNFLKDLGTAEKTDLPAKSLPAGEGKPRREALAEFVVNHDNFAKAYVNRIWGHLFGRGLNKEPAVDDFGGENEVIHTELLSRLADDFSKYKYDPKLLLEWICNSDVYSLSHVAPKEYVDQKYDPFFVRMPLKALSPEVLFESLMTATKAEESANSDKRKQLRERWMSKLVQNFGDDEGNEMTFNGTVVQALLMMNGRELNEEIGPKGADTVQKVVNKYSKGGATNSVSVIDELFLMTLNRRPTTDERTKLSTLQSRGAIVKLEAAPANPPKSAAPPATPPKGKGKLPPMPPSTPGVVPPANGPNDVTFYQDVFWALLNTNEFMLNH